MYPSDRHYSREHEWVLLESDGRALIGITTYAQEQLGDVVYVDLSGPGAKVDQSQKLGEIESVKAVSDVYCPVAGEVVEINQELVGHSELINEDPYGEGWMVRLASVDSAQLENLLSAETYENYLSQLE